MKSTRGTAADTTSSDTPVLESRLENPAASQIAGEAASSPARKDHVLSIDCLRGIAALAVCCCHTFLQGPLTSVTYYGWLGVYVFFVVSGFVIPFSLWRGNYVVRAYPRFIAKRLVRLDPPYLISMAVAIGLHYVSNFFPQFHGSVPHYSMKIILMHFAYLNTFFGGMGSWIIPVYWTLGIEFQYYLLIGLLYPLVSSRRLLAQITIVVLCIVGSGFRYPIHPTVDQGPLIGHYSLAFLIGILTFRLRAGLLAPRAFALLAVIFAALLSVTSGATVGVTTLGTALVIASGRLNLKILAWLGSISYSLYLFHMLVVDRVLHVGLRMVHSEPLVFVVQLIAIAASVLVAWVMARLVEEPFKRIAARIRLTPRTGTSIA